MPKHGNDNLENFFRKVSDLPDIPFNEEDWKKLEVRLDAKELHVQNASSRRNRLTGAVVLSILLMSSYFWLGKFVNQQTNTEKASIVEAPLVRQEVSDVSTVDAKPAVIQEEGKLQKELVSETESKDAGADILHPTKSEQLPSVIDVEPATADFSAVNSRATERLASELGDEQHIDLGTTANNNESLTDQINTKTGSDEVTQVVPVVAEKNKQKASIQLPEAEEGDATVSKVLGIDKAKLSASPRLSLLLSLAPDFSSTSFGEYSDPGEAFGVIVHYHVKNAWSFSAGIVKSNKKYTGDGEDYHPPKGYWKHYTNGIIPASVDGACSVLEIPLMIQYTVAEVGRSKFRVGAGVSSYIMLNESYQYNFEEPNPGARDGWSSTNNSGFLFNMINVTLVYEYQILPRLLVGVEPYLKIPIEEIGWSNLKLFSTGASLTLRYNVLSKKHSTLSIRDRGPD